MLTPPPLSLLPPAPAIAVVVVACGVLLGTVAWWRGRSQPPPELTRKAVHVGMGVIALSLPWLFSARWPVLALCGGLAGAFMALKRFARRSDLGAAMHDVNRASLGDLYFAFSVGVLWVLAAGDRLLFVVPVLVLTLGDAVAALVGVRYGRTRFDGRATGKSLEGSVALFAVTFLSVHLPLSLVARVAPLDAILIAASMSVMVVLLEAAAWRGLDNIFVPVGAYLLLRAWLPAGRPLETSVLAWNLAATVALLVIVIVVRRRTTLRDAALAGAALFACVVWMLGGWRWVVAPATLFLAYTRLFPAARREADGGEVREHDMHAVAGVVMPALAWLFAARAFGRPDLLAPYTATFVAQLAMIGVVRASAHAPGGTTVRLLGVVAKGALLVLPAMALHRPWTQAAVAAAVALAGALVAGVAINRGTNGVAPGLDEEQQWLRQSRWAAAASLVTALALLA